jgi:hypothetical protein
VEKDKGDDGEGAGSISYYESSCRSGRKMCVEEIRCSCNYCNAIFFFFFFFKVNNLYTSARVQSGLYLSTIHNDHSIECPTVEVKICSEMS